MTLKIQTEQDDQRQLLMTIEVPEDRVEKQMRQTARKLAKEVSIPGFRRGKVPYQVLVKRIGRDALRTEAVEDMLQSVFTEALDEIDPDIYAPANFDDMEMEPLVLKFTIPLTPEVTLGEYRELRKEIEPVEVSEEALSEALERIQTQHQQLEDVDRPVEKGDMVTLSGKGELLPGEEEEEEPEAEAEETEDGGAEIEVKEAPEAAPSQGGRNIDAMLNVGLQVQIVLGRSRMPISQVLKLTRGSIIELDKKMGDPVEILINDRLVAKGDLVKLAGDRLGVELTEIVKDYVPGHD